LESDLDFLRDLIMDDRSDVSQFINENRSTYWLEIDYFYLRFWGIEISFEFHHTQFVKVEGLSLHQSLDVLFTSELQIGFLRMDILYNLFGDFGSSQDIGDGINPSNHVPLPLPVLG